MRYLTLVVREDESLGEIGLMVEHVNMINTPMVTKSGLVIAHDILEHVNGFKSIGSVDDEIEALATTWYIRGQYSDLSREVYGNMYSPEESIGSDIGNLAEIYNRGVNFRTRVPVTRPSDMDDAFKEIIGYGMRSFRKEIEYDDAEINHSRMTYYEAAAMHYMRAGYRKARKRYNSALKANTMFWNIARAVDPVAKHAEFEGQKFRLSYDSRSARCEEIYDEYIW